MFMIQHFHLFSNIKLPRFLVHQIFTFILRCCASGFYICLPIIQTEKRGVKIMKNPDICRKIMYLLIFTGLMIANGSAILSGTDTMSLGFIIGGFITVGGILFGYLTVHFL